MAAALERHNAILAGAIDAHGGHVFKTVGDAYCAAFSNAGDALESAVEAQRALHAERFQLGPDGEPLRVRMGIHTGLVELKDGDYFGRPVNRVARLMSAGHGGQILVSLATQQLVRDALPKGCELADLGVHRLKDLEHSEHIYRLVAPGMPEVDTPPDTAERIGAGERAALPDLLPDATCPDRGLHAFREEDSRFFFGREVFTDLLAGTIDASPMAAIIGASGSGKSSVVHAGLVPRLRAESKGSGAWTVLDMRPGSRPFHALAGVLVPLLEPDITATGRLVEVRRMAEALADGTIGLPDLLELVGEKQPAIERILLLADQFEELYTLCPDERDQRTFQDILFAAAFEGRDGPQLKLGLTLRADFMGHALAYRPFADAVQHHQVVLGPMNREELARVIARPAELQGRAFEHGLVERIMDDVGEKAGRLPLLEFALTRLWDGQKAGWLTHEAYEGIGRVEGAVARHADEVFERLAKDEQDRTRRVFVQLVQPGEGTEDTRRLATHDEFGEAWSLVQRLADERLVTTGRDADDNQTAEVVHEALIRSWGRLVGWMKEDRRFRMWQERLRFAIRQWEETGRDEGALLRGVPLAEAERWQQERDEELSEAESTFIASGVHARVARQTDARRVERRVQMLMRAVVAVSLIGLIVSASLAAIARRNERAADVLRREAEHDVEHADIRELARQAESLVVSDPSLAGILALHALSRASKLESPALSDIVSTFIAPLLAKASK